MNNLEMIPNTKTLETLLKPFIIIGVTILSLISATIAGATPINPIEKKLCLQSLLSQESMRTTVSFSDFIEFHSHSVSLFLQSPQLAVNLPRAAVYKRKKHIENNTPFPVDFVFLTPDNIDELEGLQMFVLQEGELGIRINKSSHVIASYGEPAYSAGEINIEKSTINPGYYTLTVNNQSGTYKPRFESLAVLVDLVVGLQLPVDIIKLNELRRFPSGKELMVPRYKISTKEAVVLD